MMTILELYAWALGKGDELRIVIDENVAIDRDEATVTL